MSEAPDQGVSLLALRQAEHLAEIRTDVKHILASLPEMKQEFAALERRLTAVEKFNTRVLGMAALAVPGMTLLVNWLLANYDKLFFRG